MITPDPVLENLPVIENCQLPDTACCQEARTYNDRIQYNIRRRNSVNCIFPYSILANTVIYIYPCKKFLVVNIFYTKRLPTKSASYLHTINTQTTLYFSATKRKEKIFLCCICYAISA